MKYGDTLSQRSVPEWVAYNVDYNEIKRLIKVRTTRGQAEAISIPGHANEGKALREFEDELYAELCEQHQRIDLFVQSKSGEIKRKLNHLHKQVLQLARHNFPRERSRISIRKLERYAQIEEAVLKAGEELQSLSRFVGAQRLAFQKLLKKYRKWTGSPVLGRRIQRDVLGRPSTFSQDYFETLLEEWTDVLIAVRAPFKVNTSGSANGAAFAPAVAERGDSTKAGELAEEYREAESFPPCAAHLHELADRGTDVELDTALATSRLGHPAGRACYWVHPDNVVELQVLLLQYTRLRNVSNSRSCSSSSTSHRPSRRTAVNSQGISSFSAVEDETGHFVLDDLVTFSKNQSAANINDAENAAGKRLGKAAVGIRYCTSGEAIIVIGTSPEPPNLESPTGNLTVLKAKVKRKHLQSLFDCSTSKLPPQRSVDEVTQATTHQSPDPTQELDNVRKWLAGHPTVRPLVELQYRRTRFVGLGNNTTRGLWASLDREITMRKAINHFGSSEGQPSPNEGKGGLADDVSFPYVLLHIRWEGDSGADLVRALDQTHLTERVRGFSLETHAVAVLYKPKHMSPPSWLPALTRDIRKLPPPTSLSRRRSSTLHSSQGSGATKHTSNSAISTADGPSGSGFSNLEHETPSTSVPDLLLSPPLGAFKKKRRALKEQPSRKEMNQSSCSKYQRCWNEFDDGDEISDNEPYTILVDPDGSNGLPGLARVSKLADAIVARVKVSTEKFTEWLSPRSKANNDARPSLIKDQSAPMPEAEDSDDSSTEQLYQHRRYSTFPNYDRPIHPAFRNRETLLSRLCITAFAISFILLFIAAILEASARRKAALPADVGLLVGVIAALASSVAGIGFMYAREDPLSWLHRFTALVAFGLVCVGSGVLLAVVGTG